VNWHNDDKNCSEVYYTHTHTCLIFGHVLGTGNRFSATRERGETERKDQEPLVKLKYNDIASLKAQLLELSITIVTQSDNRELPECMIYLLIIYLLSYLLISSPWSGAFWTGLAVAKSWRHLKRSCAPRRVEAKILLLKVEHNCSNLLISPSTETSLSGSQLSDHRVLPTAKLQLFHQHCTYRTWASANGARGAIHNRPLVMTTYDRNDQRPRLPTSRIIDYDNVIKRPARQCRTNDASFSHLNCSYKLPAILPVYLRA